MSGSISISISTTISLIKCTCDKFRAASFPSTSKSSVCWDTLQTFGYDMSEASPFYQKNCEFPEVCNTSVDLTGRNGANPRDPSCPSNQGPLRAALTESR